MTTLDFGLMYEITVPKPWTDRSERENYMQVVDQVVLAEQLGYSHFWTVEHHFMEEFSHCSAPEVFYGYIAARTSRIRIGHGVRLLPFNYNHPVRVAEMASVVDIMCDGRLEFGTGRSGSRLELEGFGIDPNRARDEWEEALEMVVKAWTTEEFEWDSPRWKFPKRNVIPKPLQKPHPPLWAACTSASTHEIAGSKGIGLLSFTLMVPLPELERRIGLYRAALEDCTPVGQFVNDQTATFTLVHCAETNEEARATAARSIEWYVHYSLKQIAALGEWQDGRDLPTYDYVKTVMGLDLDEITFEYLDNNDMCIVGDPDHCIEMVKKYGDTGITQMITMHDGVFIPHDKVRRSIELFGQHVIPAFNPLAATGTPAAASHE